MEIHFTLKHYTYCCWWSLMSAQSTPGCCAKIECAIKFPYRGRAILLVKQSHRPRTQLVFMLLLKIWICHLSFVIPAWRYMNLIVFTLWTVTSLFYNLSRSKPELVLVWWTTLSVLAELLVVSVLVVWFVVVVFGSTMSVLFKV